MRHTKPFTRRLACALWLTIGVWVPVEATEVCLSADRSWLREDAGRTEITVTAVHYPANTNCGNLTGVNPSAVNSDTYINLTSSTQGLNARFRIEFLSTVIIRQGESQASATVVLTPIEDGLMGDDAVDDGLNDDLDISIYGSAGTGINVQTSPLIWLLDDDKASTWIYLSVSPSELSTKAGPTPIVVTAMLNGQRASSHLNLTLVIDESNSSVKRDADFGASGLGAITIRKNRSVGTATITIDPKDNKPGVISLAVTGLPSGLNYWQVSPIVVRQTGPRITQVTLSPFVGARGGWANQRDSDRYLGGVVVGCRNRVFLLLEYGPPYACAGRARC